MLGSFLGSLIIVASCAVCIHISLRGGRSWPHYFSALVFTAITIAFVVKMLITHHPLY